MIMITVAFLIGFILCSLFGVPYIDFLKKKTIGQYVKDVAPQNHAKKEGTPISLSEGDEVTFVRLAMLAGRMW